MTDGDITRAVGTVGNDDLRYYFKNGADHLKRFPESSPGRDMILGKKSPLQNGILKMDIHPLRDSADWFRIDSDYSDMLKKKRDLIGKYPEEVLAVTPEGIPGARELPWVIASHLCHHFPGSFSLKGAVFFNHLSGQKVDLSADRNPMESAALMVQEDLILIHERSDQRYYLSAGALCFPSAWSLREKLGNSIMAIHGPVPVVNEQLGKVINRFLLGIKPGQHFWRINFLTTTSPRLSQLKNVPDMMDYRNKIPVTWDNVGGMILRNERETLTRLPESGDILFTLKTYMTPFNQLSPFTAGQLAGLLKMLPRQSITEYREWSMEDFDCVISYLVNRSERPEQ